MPSVIRLPTHNDRIMHPPSQLSSSTPDMGFTSASTRDSTPIKDESLESLMLTQGLNAVAGVLDQMPLASKFDSMFDPIPTISPHEYLDLPFIYRPHLSGTVCQLISIEEQIQNLHPLSNELRGAIAHAMQTTIIFPSSLDVYEYDSAADPQSGRYWTCRATIKGEELGQGLFPSRHFVKQGGVTFKDCQTMLSIMKKRSSTNDLWLEIFEPRGMPLDHFNGILVNLHPHLEALKKEDESDLTTPTKTASAVKRRATRQSVRSSSQSNNSLQSSPRTTRMLKPMQENSPSTLKQESLLGSEMPDPFVLDSPNFQSSLARPVPSTLTSRSLAEEEPARQAGAYGWRHASSSKWWVFPPYEF